MKKYLELIKGKWQLLQEKIRKQLNRLNPKQRLLMLIGMVVLFFAMDCLYIWKGFRGNTGQRIEIKHIREVPLDAFPPTSKQHNESLKMNEYETDSSKNNK